jgi:glycosyltransferase involved in cell wall biosynthesis
MKVAIVHDWLVVYGGAERVLKELLTLFPQADLYSTVCFVPDDQSAFLGGRTVRTTFLQRLPGAAKYYRSYLPLMPLAIEQLDLSAYDLVVSSSYAVAKGVITGPDQLHVCYLHSPIRYAWDLQHGYLRETGLNRGLKGLLARALLHYIRLWDMRTACGVDSFVANSRFVARRIQKVYRREATVIHPPVDVEVFTPSAKAGSREDLYLTASRLVPYKRVPLIVDAFATAMPDRRLVVIGDGPEMAEVRAKAGPNIAILGYQPEAVLCDYMRRARAFVFAAEEDFGIAPLEAQACGTPVIAYARGGCLETIRGLDHQNEDGTQVRSPAEAPTGLHFAEQTPEAIVTAVRRFETSVGRITPEACRANALRFAAPRFRERFRAHVERELRAFPRYGVDADDEPLHEPSQRDLQPTEAVHVLRPPARRAAGP